MTRPGDAHESDPASMVTVLPRDMQSVDRRIIDDEIDAWQRQQCPGCSVPLATIQSWRTRATAAGLHPFVHYPPNTRVVRTSSGGMTALVGRSQHPYVTTGGESVGQMARTDPGVCRYNDDHLAAWVHRMRALGLVTA